MTLEPYSFRISRPRKRRAADRAAAPDPRPDGTAPSAEGHREDGPGFHQRRTIETRERVPEQDVRAATRRRIIAGFRANGVRLAELAGHSLRPR